LLGWATSSSATTTNYSTLSGVNNDWINTNAPEKTIYAVWKANTYTVKFNANNGSGTMNNQSFTYDTAQNLTANTFTRTGYTFSNWNTKADGTGTTYANKASVKNLTSTSGGTVNLYAQWTAKTIVVTFNKNDGSGTTATQTFTYGVSGQTFSNKNWTRSGYTLLGWATSSSATTTNYSTLSGVSNDWINTNSPSTTLYAVWKRVGYSIIENFASYTVHDWDFSTTIDKTQNGSTWGLEKSGSKLIYTCGAGKQNVNLNPIFDLSKYKTLVIKVSEQTLNTSKGIRIGFVTYENRGNDNFEAKDEIYNVGTYEVDLSGLTSNLYFAIRPINDTSYQGTLTISELTLEE